MEPVPDFDLYAELEVSRTASTPTIDAAWRSLLKRHHPDLGGPQAAARTVRLNVAHDWLTDPSRRERYDAVQLAARRERAAARAAAARREPAPADPVPDPRPGARPAAGPTPRPATGPTPRPARAAEPVRTPPRLGSGRDRRVAMVAVAVVAILVGGPRVLSAIAGPNPNAPAAVGPTRDPGRSIALPSVPASAGGSVAAPGRSASPQPSASAGPVLTISGGGDHPPAKLQIGGGTYRVDFVVTSLPGESCPWAMFLTDARGLDLLLASAYPSDETVRDSARDAGVVGGTATVRVESGCPRWSATVTRLGP